MWSYSFYNMDNPSKICTSFKYIFPMWYMIFLFFIQLVTMALVAKTALWLPFWLLFELFILGYWYGKAIKEFKVLNVWFFIHYIVKMIFFGIALNTIPVFIYDKENYDPSNDYFGDVRKYLDFYPFFITLVCLRFFKDVILKF